jgi:hypothetical protein
MPPKIETTEQAGAAIRALTPAKVEMLVKLMRKNIPALRGKSDAHIRGILRNTASQGPAR